MNRRLLVPLDGMPLAERALPLARVLAGVLSADVQLLRGRATATSASSTLASA